MTCFQDKCAWSSPTHDELTRSDHDEFSRVIPAFAGTQIHGAGARLWMSLYMIESLRAWKDASTIFGETPTVNQ